MVHTHKKPFPETHRPCPAPVACGWFELADRPALALQKEREDLRVGTTWMADVDDCGVASEGNRGWQPTSGATEPARVRSGVEAFALGISCIRRLCFLSVSLRLSRAYLGKLSVFA
jgi:hypothetical protein